MNGYSAEGGAVGGVVQWMGVILYSKIVCKSYKSLHPVSTAPPFDES